MAGRQGSGHRCRTLLCFALLGVLAACAGARQGGSDSPACPGGLLDRASGTTEVTFWHAMSAQNEVALKGLVSSYNALQDRVKVNLVFQGSYDDALQKYMASAGGGDRPDIVQLQSNATQLMIDSHSAVPAQACVDAEHYDLSDYVKRAIDYYSVGGRLWPMPFNVSDLVLYYNKKAFEKAGLDPARPPATLAELRDDAQRIVSSGAAAHGIALDLSAGYVEQWFASAGEQFVDHQNGRQGRAGKVLFDDPLGLELFSTLKSMLASGEALSVGRNSGGTQTFLAVASKDAAMTLGSSASLGSLLSTLAAGQVRDVELGVGPLPAPPGSGGVSVGGGALWLVRGSQPVRQEAAWRFMKWLGEPEQQATLHTATGYLPGRRSAADLPAVRAAWAARPAFRVGYDELLHGADNAASAGPVIGPIGKIQEAVVQALEEMTLRGGAPATVLHAAAATSNAAMVDYNRRVGG